MNSTRLYIVCKSAIYRSIILFPLQSNDIVLIILNLLVCNCRAEISPRPVSQDVHLCTTFYLYRLNYAAHTLQILCFCQQLVYFWGDKSRTDDKQPLSVSVDSVRLDTLQIVIAHTIDSRVTSPTGQFQTGRIWIMISLSLGRRILFHRYR